MKVLFLILVSLTSTLFAETKVPLTNDQLDQMIIKACTAQSGESECQSRIKAVRNKLKPNELLSKAPALPVDSEINVVIASDAEAFKNDYYCLAIFNKIISMKEVEADVFPFVVYGFSFSDQSINSYNKWIKTNDAKSCLKNLSNVKPAQADQTKKITIVLNPVTFLENGTGEEFNDLAARIYNHERLHAIYSTSKAKAKTAALWKSMSAGEKQQFKSEHPNYQFKLSDILYRELFSYTFDHNPKAAYDFLNAKKAVSYSQLKKTICEWCVDGNKEILSKVVALSNLEPKDLLKKLEEEKIKVLILSSGRKNPSDLFYWGKVRVDNGELNQISKIEGAMGKTLCQGERAESSNSTTIILASDSPYSTLLHEYLHVEQIRMDPSWCPVSKRLWSDPPLISETRMIRDREWDVRLVLWDLLQSPMMNVEDKIIVSEGLIREGELRSKFDPDAKRFLADKKVQEFFQKNISDYQKSMTKK